MERHRPSDATPASAGHQTDGFTCFTQAQFWQCYHYLWLVKADIRKPAEYGTVLGFLLAYRVVEKLRARRHQPALASAKRTTILQN